MIVVLTQFDKRCDFFQSSLIQAILRELPLSEGSISVSGTVSYAAQEPWLFSGSIKQNILFGLPMDKERYKKVSTYLQDAKIKH